VSRRRERGVALLAAVTAVAVMTALGVGLAHTAIVGQLRTEDALATLQADALARSGVAVAAVALAETNAAGAPDTLAAPWAQEFGRQRLGAGWVEVRIEDEARRLDFGAPELADALPRLLRVLGLDPALADGILDWVDPDDEPRPAGAERDWYLAHTPPRVPRNAPFATVGEVGMVRGVDAAVLARLRPYIGVAGEHAVNPNTASREVLLAVIDDAATVDRLLAARARGPIDDPDLPALLGDAPPAVLQALATHGQRYTVRAVAGVDRTTRGVQATLWAPGGADPSVVSWRPFVPDAAPASRSG
jgi:general secretion pathway protein K